ncbi:hypothetical protein G7046_g5012 [Stylonectria norvegica]|nr:hypothetical protein G7046_g5012 [Stylonectria norvegica]
MAPGRQGKRGPWGAWVTAREVLGSHLETRSTTAVLMQTGRGEMEAHPKHLSFQASKHPGAWKCMGTVNDGMEKRAHTNINYMLLEDAVYPSGRKRPRSMLARALVLCHRRIPLRHLANDGACSQLSSHRLAFSLMQNFFLAATSRETQKPIGAHDGWPVLQWERQPFGGRFQPSRAGARASRGRPTPGKRNLETHPANHPQGKSRDVSPHRWTFISICNDGSRRRSRPHPYARTYASNAKAGQTPTPRERAHATTRGRPRQTCWGRRWRPPARPWRQILRNGAMMEQWVEALKFLHKSETSNPLGVVLPLHDAHVLTVFYTLIVSSSNSLSSAPELSRPDTPSPSISPKSLTHSPPRLPYITYTGIPYTGIAPSSFPSPAAHARVQPPS